MTIRPATRGDADAVLALWEVGRTAHATTEDRRVDIERMLDQQPGALIVAEENGAIVGTVIAGSDGWRGSLWRLAVHPEQRRRGLGRQLVSAAEDRLRTLGIPRVQALVGRDDEDARAFWTSAGYPVEPGTVRHVRNV
jgi:ribosomal protein S18 acetylase RimI-like enzyme